MSSGQKPRTPEYFPRMKERGRARRRRIERAWRRLPDPSPLTRLLHEFADLARTVTEPFRALAAALDTTSSRKSDYALTPAEEQDTL